MSFLFGRKKSIVVSLSGTEVPIFLLDETQVIVKINPTTTAAAALFHLRSMVRVCV